MPDGTVYLDAAKPEKKIDRRLVTIRQFEEGGMSLLYEALDTNLMRGVAMKILRDDKKDNENELSRMVVEAQITSQLDHPNIVPIYELGMDKKKRLFFTMKKIQGKALHELIHMKDISSRTEKELFRLIQIMIKVFDAVSYAHSKGVLHRDLKPDNIMVGDFGQVYLMDWGIARVKSLKKPDFDDVKLPGFKRRRRYNIVQEEEGNVLGTPCYMSPEQAQGDQDSIDERSDIFSLGAILYEILTGTRPIPGNSLQDMVFNARKCEIQPPRERVDFPLPLGLVRITMKAMSREPADRYQSVEEFKTDLEDFLEGIDRFPGRTYKAGDFIVREGEHGDEAYIIRSGKCRAFKTINGEKVELRRMEAGEVFGETSVLTGKPRSASVQTIDDVTVAVVNSRYFKDDMEVGAWLSPFLKTLAERFREADQKAKG